MRVVIDRRRCMGSGSCQFWAPSTFDLDDDCRAVATDPPADPPTALRHAAQACPTGAITLEEAAGC